MLENIEKNIKNIITKQFGLKDGEITNNLSLKHDLWADSLHIAEFIASLEAEFKIKVSAEEEERIETIQDAVDSVKKLLQKTGNF